MCIYICMCANLGTGLLYHHPILLFYCVFTGLSIVFLELYLWHVVRKEGLRLTMVVAELLSQPKIRELLRKTKLIRDLAGFRGLKTARLDLEMA